MALIKCPKCEKKISDTTNKCIHCGCEFEKIKRYYCDECGSTVNVNDKKCSNCGALLYSEKEIVCVECGEKHLNSEEVCPHCGYTEELLETDSISEDKEEIMLNIISFLIPTVGLILYVVYANTKPIKAKGIGIWAIVGFIFDVIIWLIFFAVITSHIETY